ncbi:MAG: zinc-dependent metalloprotease [Solirubrobacterales bacterium]|nr:zinc-dependent metalloprotease [Solirubrobacterales bacterium]
MDRARPALDHDWLGACRRAADGVREVLHQHPTSRERVEETGTVGGGGDRTLVIDQQAEDCVFRELERLHGEGARFSAVSEERGLVDFGDDGTLVVIDPIDGSLNAKRGLTHHALSIAVATGPTMADVVLGYVHDFGPDEEWWARAGEGAWVNGERLDPPPERRSREGKLEVVAVESADPRWLALAADELSAATYRVRAIGSIAISLCQLAAARVDGMATLRNSRADERREYARRIALVRAMPRCEPVAFGPNDFPFDLELDDDHRSAHIPHQWFPMGDDAGPPAPARLAELAADAQERVVAVTGLQPRAPLPPVEWVDRGTWIDANVTSMRATLGPAVERSMARSPGALQAAAGAVVAAEVGALLGMFARRILGQYELNLLDPDAPPRLLLVAPNLRKVATDLELDHDELVTWVTLHEVTHGVQFSSVGWLREQLAGLLRELLGALEVKPDLGALLRVDLSDLRGLVDQVRRGGLVAAVLGNDRAGLLDRLQSTMALVEGHAEWAMDRAGEDVLRDLPQLREALDRRRGGRPPLLKLLDQLLGMEMKLRQYEVGRRFCDAVAAERGDAGVREAWDSPAMAPSSAELADPSTWLARTRPAA